MKTVSIAEMVYIDEQTIEEDCVPGGILMDWAGEQLSIEIRKVYDYMPVKPEKVVFFAGKGNNGGDAFVAAKYLAEWGLSSDIYLTSSANSIVGDASFYLSEVSQCDCVKLQPYVKDIEAFPFLRTARPGSMIVVDALLGTGVVGEPRSNVKDAIELINKLGRTNYVVSVDIPSGLNGDTGEKASTSVKADLTVSMAYPKKGFVEQDAIECIGRLEVVDIGIERKPAKRKEQTSEFLARQDVSKMFNKRVRVSHKGTYGKILIIGGARGFSGAPAMSAMSALKSGAGLVSLLVPESIAPIVSAMCPEAMVHWGKENNGALTQDSLKKSDLDIEQFDAILIGPGMTVCEETKELLRWVVSKANVPVVLDADALNIISSDISILSDNGQYVLTPHVGEIARLIDKSINDVVSSRFSSLMTVVHKYNAHVVLKGAGTIVALKKGKRYVNLNGNPGMATAGSGDVLAGMLVGFIPQIGFENAICASVFLHGLSGDFAAFQHGQISMSAASIINAIPTAIQDVLGR